MTARALFFGSGGFAVPVFEALLDAPETEVVGVVTAPARPAGRKGDLTPTPVAMRAAALGLPVLTPERLRHPEALAALAATAPAIGILSDYGKILPQAVLDLPPHGILNLHPSLLPRWRGATPIPNAILAGDAETGVSLFRMDAGMDTGDLVAAVRTPLGSGEDGPALEARLALLAGDLLRANLAGWLDGTTAARPQPVDGVTLTRPLRREDGRLDLAAPAAALARAVMAYRPWPGTFLETPEGRLVVVEASAANGDGEPGTIVVAGGAPALVTPDGLLVLRVVRPAGGREMPGDAYLRGRPGVLGSRVGRSEK